MNGLSERVAIVTGATGLIGSAIAKRLLQEGAIVVIASRQLAKARAWIDEHSEFDAKKLRPLELDLASETSIDAALEQLGGMASPPTILIANASSRDGIQTPLADISHDLFARLTATDVAGHFLLARGITERLRKDERASMVFMSSIYGSMGVDHSIYPAGMSPTPPQYAAVKGGILGLTRYLAALWGERGVRVNAVIAGGVRSPAQQDDGFASRYSSKTMLGRMAAPEEVASAAVFLASTDASYITGAFLAADGGFSGW